MTRVCWVVVGLLLAKAAVAQQQRIPRYGELRADAVMGSGAAVHAGAGLVFPLGVYTRLGVDVAGGALWRDGATKPGGRAEAVARFLLDPFRESPIGFSLGGGISVTYASVNKTVRPYVTAVMDIEGRRRGSLTPALQIGLGGGTRVGVVLRASPRQWR